ncbi:MAG: tetratricopeptide repeat protein [Deltaproteobacteria bacterium]|nr:tetratricopeptide repeat protein [Deltaproteobacteria bacterium]
MKRLFVYIIAGLCMVTFFNGELIAQKKGKGAQKPQEQVRPDLRFEDQYFKVGSEMEEIRDKELETMNRMLKLGVSDEEKPKILFRMAEIYSEKAKFRWMKFMEKTNEETMYEKQPEKLKMIQKEKETLKKQQENFRQKALEMYKALIDKYPNYPRIDEVYFYYGFNLMDMGEQEEALKIYRTLIKEYPESKYVPDAYLSFGEYYFNRGDLQRAIEAYKRAAKDENSRVYGYALYKMAWVYYNLGEWDRALDIFEKVITYSLTNVEENKENKLTLQKEAMKDFVLTYSNSGNVSDAKERFLRIAGPEKYLDMLRTLAQLLFDQGKDNESIEIHKLLISEKPDDMRNLTYQARIVESHDRRANKRQVVEEARVLVDMFKNIRSKVPDKKLIDQTTDPNEKKKLEEMQKNYREAEELTEALLRKLATTYHNEAKKTGSEKTFFMAHELYGDYLELFPNAKDAYTLNFYYAELLYKLKKWESAGDAYLKVVKMDPKGDLNLDAIHSAIVAYKNAAKGIKLPSAKIKTPVEIPPLQKKRIDAMQKYVGILSQDKKPPKLADDKWNEHKERLPDITYEIGYLFYSYNYFKEANRMFAEVALKYPDSKVAEYAVNLILDSFNLAQNWAELNRWTREFLKNPKIAKGKVLEDLKRLVAESAFKLIEDYEKKGEYETAAKKYYDFQQEFPDTKMADTALYNAAANYSKAQKFEDSIKMRILLIEKYPKSSLAPKTLYSIAESFRDEADYENAAKYYLKFVEMFPKEKDAPTALFNAGTYLLGLEMYQEAIDARRKYLKDYPKEADIPDVHLSIAKIYNIMKDKKKELEVYQEFEKKYSKTDVNKLLPIIVKQGLLLQELGNQKEAEKKFDQAIKIYEKSKEKDKFSPEALEAVAHAKFIMVAPVYAQFDAIKLEMPEATFKKRFSEKTKAMERVYKAYADIVNIKVAEWAIASLYKIGQAYEEFIKSFLEMPIPKELKTKQQKDLYKQMIREQTMPLEEKAVAHYQAALSKSSELGVFNKWSVESLKRLYELRPQEYPSGDEIKPQADNFRQFLESNPFAMAFDWDKKVKEMRSQKKEVEKPRQVEQREEKKSAEGDKEKIEEKKDEVDKEKSELDNKGSSKDKGDSKEEEVGNE